MTRQRTLEIQARFSDSARDLDSQRLCEICVDVAGVDGAGIMMMSGDVQRGSLCTTNVVSARIEELQFSLSEGPCLDAFHEDRPVLEPDLEHPTDVRWLAFSGAALDAGVRAIFGFPIHVGSVKLGALNLYNDTRGALTARQHADCLVLAVVARSVIMLQAHATPGQLAAEFEAGSEFELVVHRASGMVAAQLETSVAQALIRMQAHAFGNGESLRSVARAVVGRSRDVAVGGGVEADDHPHGRRLAAAVRAEEAGDLAGRDGEAQVVDGPNRAVPLRQPAAVITMQPSSGAPCPVGKGRSMAEPTSWSSGSSASGRV